MLRMSKLLLRNRQTEASTDHSGVCLLMLLLYLLLLAGYTVRPTKNIAISKCSRTTGPLIPSHTQRDGRTSQICCAEEGTRRALVSC